MWGPGCALIPSMLFQFPAFPSSPCLQWGALGGGRSWTSVLEASCSSSAALRLPTPGSLLEWGQPSVPGCVPVGQGAPTVACGDFRQYPDIWGKCFWVNLTWHMGAVLARWVICLVEGGMTTTTARALPPLLSCDSDL